MHIKIMRIIKICHSSVHEQFELNVLTISFVFSFGNNLKLEVKNEKKFSSNIIFNNMSAPKTAKETFFGYRGANNSHYDTISR